MSGTQISKCNDIVAMLYEVLFKAMFCLLFDWELSKSSN